jgi:hypothetical protein
MEARNRLQSKLLVAEKQVAEGATLKDHEDVMKTIRRKINAAKENH